MCVLLVAALAAEAASAQSLERLKALAVSAQSFRADFTYTVSSVHWDDRQVSSGSLVLQGMQYRIDTSTETIITHGPDMYVYRPLENQVLITTGEHIYSLSTLFGDFEEYYKVTETRPATYDGARHFAVRLAPRDDESSLREVTLWIRAADDMVTRILSVDVNDTTMDFELTSIDLNPEITSDTFALPFPESAEVIDLRS